MEKIIEYTSDKEKMKTTLPGKDDENDNTPERLILWGN